LAHAKVFCTQHHLIHHLDEARVFNASVKLGVDVIEIVKHYSEKLATLYHETVYRQTILNAL
ncbi:MAG TPA: hypothetical protein PLD88_10630, partial [Candidatus Berkiella sp.]|nr:hypothetical protein [Candidatus Berkiella sp.]